jgi:hypothetical protein
MTSSQDVLKPEIVKVGEEQYQIKFRIDSYKERACPVVFATWRYIYDHTFEPAIIYYDDNKGPKGRDTQFRYGPTLDVGPFISRPLRSDIPRAAYSYEVVVLEGIFWYRCHPFWWIPTKILIPIYFPDRDGDRIPEIPLIVDQPEKLSLPQEGIHTQDN